ncbi:hypothetical protein KG112_00600 [Nocardioides sp. zg-ZUI104]|uniref:maltokinase N-terminal cap-like domain-containing protein n=1 Tax=Nocardioides faecalis TaxID=2803858 RepID=UPI001BD0B4E1|nr:hypothetical protein [Nocardioides faecalis]MBS4751302.1 hypothetical protein [Nocardioides faecalis]
MATASELLTHVDHEALHAYLERARWFGSKGRRFTVSEVHVLGEVAPPPGEAAASPAPTDHSTRPAEAAREPRVVVALAEVAFDDGGEPERYQLPLALYDEPQERLDHAFVGRWPAPDGAATGTATDAGAEVVAYDAVQDRAAMALYLRSFETGSGSAIGFVRLGGHELDLTAPGSPFTGEQSNSSVFFGEDSVLKLFRKVTPGENPDVTTHRVLTEAGSTHVAHLYGWIEHDDTHLGMLQQFLRTASDGWGIALASVRDLFAEADLHAEEVGGDFASEAARLGEALAEVHAQLREAFPTDTVDAAHVAQVMTDRLEAAIEVVPQLAEHADAARAVFAAMAGLGELPVQRVHADLHLGQTLRTVGGWKLVDFEGEPAKTMDERVRPDSPWRDVAGMTRSFDYAPHAVAASMPEQDPDVLHQRAIRAGEWARRNRKAFLAAYCGDAGFGAEDRTLLTAYVVDKAIYECVYEARNRPTWLSIPLEGVARLTSD